MQRACPALTPAFAADAFQADLYRHYRDFLLHTPVFRSGEGVVYLTRYDDCVELLGNPAFRRSPPDGGSSPFSAYARAAAPLETMISQWMVFMDPPRHDVVRKAFMPAFAAKAVRQLEPRIREQSRQLIDALPREGAIDFLGQFAFPLPVGVIAGILGVPGSDAAMFRDWSRQLTQALDRGNDEDVRSGSAVALQLKSYFGDLIAARDTLPRGCLIGNIARGREPALSADELLYGCAFLLWAGHETTKNLLANGILILAERPDAFALLQRQPELIASAVEEMLRLESPLQKLSRWTHDAAAFGEYAVPRGTLVTALVGAANRDPAVFDRPDTFDIGRAHNRHIAFGVGMHHCLGATLARTEARIAFGELLARLRRLEPINHRWRTYSAFRSMETLHARASLAC